MLGKLDEVLRADAKTSNTAETQGTNPIEVPSPRSARKAALAIILIMAAVSVFHAYESYQAAEADAEQLLMSTTKALDYQISRTFRAVNDLLADAVQRIDPYNWPDERLRPWLGGQLGAYPEIGNLLVIKADGQSAGPGLKASGEVGSVVDVSDREYFRHHRDHPSDRALHIGEPLVSRLTHELGIPVSRPILNQSGKFDGVVRVLFNPQILANGMAVVVAGQSGFNAVVRSDGIILVRVPDPNSFTGRSVASSSPFDGTLSRNPFGTTHILSPLTGETTIIAYRSIGAYPLVAVAGISQWDALTEWRRSLVRLLAVTGALSIALYMTALWSDRRESQRRLLANAALSREEDTKRELERLVAERTSALVQEGQARSQTEDALRASRERLKSITDSLFEAVLVIEADGRVAFANPSVSVQFGGEAIAELEGRHLDDVLKLCHADRVFDFAGSPWQAVFNEAAKIHDDDAVFVAPSGKSLLVAYACLPLNEAAPNRREAILSFRNIGALKAAEREVIQAQRLASVGQLAAGVAHEINTPIQYIGDNLQYIGTSVGKISQAINTLLDAGAQRTTPSGAAEFIDLPHLAEQLRIPSLLRDLPAAVTESQEGVGHITRIVRSMKEFSHPGSSSKVMTDINRAIESTLTISRNIWKYVADAITELDPSLPQVLCHAGEMNQVFLNLIVNAAQAIETSGKPLPGTITITTKRVGEQVEISVADTGTGIATSIRDRIFDPFFTTKDVGKGTGQGLAICRDVVVTKHGGHLDFGGEEGEGAVFTVRLPIQGTEADRESL